MKKVVHLITRLNIGGPTHNVALLTKYLSDDFESYVIAGKIEKHEESSEFILASEKIEPIIIESMQRSINLQKDLRCLIELIRMYRKIQPDVIHTHGAKAGFIGRLAAIICHVPYIVHTFHGHVFHSYFHPLKTKLFLKLERLIAKKTHLFIAVSKTQKNELSKSYNIVSEDKIKVVYNGFKLEQFTENENQNRVKFRTQFKIQDDEIAIGIIGRLTPIKNHDLFLRLVYEVLKINLNKKIKFLVIGGGEMWEHLINKSKEKYSLKTEVKEPKSDQYQICFTSWQYKMPEVYAGLDIVIQTSLNEGTPVCLVEAQAAGKPVISTDVGGVSDIVIHEKTGFLVPTNDLKQLSYFTTKLIDDDDLRSQIGIEGKKHALISFSFQRMVKEMEEIYLSK